MIPSGLDRRPKFLSGGEGEKPTRAACPVFEHSDCLAGAMFAQEDQYRRGGACFYKDIDFGGPKFCMGPGERMAMVPPGFNDEISSIRIFGRTEITVYKNRDYGEPRLRLRDDVANLRTYQVSPGHSWNDPISSIEVANLRDYGDF